MLKFLLGFFTNRFSVASFISFIIISFMGLKILDLNRKVTKLTKEKTKCEMDYKVITGEYNRLKSETDKLIKELEERDTLIEELVKQCDKRIQSVRMKCKRLIRRREKIEKEVAKNVKDNGADPILIRLNSLFK